LAKEGIPALHGDARVRSILRMAGCEKAKAIIISTSAAPAEAIASAARGLNPEIRVVAQTQYIRNARLMEQGGAAAVFSGEEEVALSMNDHLLRGFGATEEQVMQEHREAKKLLRAVPCK
ncbi:MAG: NAD-binding protein, partial [Akkermansia sp.]